MKRLGVLRWSLELKEIIFANSQNGAGSLLQIRKLGELKTIGFKRIVKCME